MWAFFSRYFAIIETFSCRCWVHTVQRSFSIEWRKPYIYFPVSVSRFALHCHVCYDVYAVRLYASLNVDVYKQKDKTI